MTTSPDALPVCSRADARQHQPRAVLCLSGGLDSTSLLLHLLASGHAVHAISFDYGQKHRIELERLDNNLAYLRAAGYEIAHQVLDISGLGEVFYSALTNQNWDVPHGFYAQENMKQTVVPNRNAIFASIAYGYALSVATRVQAPVKFALGVHSGDHAIYPDCRPDFYSALMRAFELGNWDSHLVELFLPYLHSDKTRILQQATLSCATLGLDFDTVFRNTWTSYQPDAEGRADGRTGSDVERILAFAELGFVDPIAYREPWEQVVEFARASQRAFESDAT
ncbi:MAG: 7-cyano-7-deazaguanine synthase [Pirellulaceae bacterium]|nr:7-cyano-7-deazaguanine synthase [Pirellulaceae bacterium]